MTEGRKFSAEAALAAHPLPWKISTRPAHEKGRRELPWQVVDGNGKLIAHFASATPASIMAKAMRDTAEEFGLIAKVEVAS